LPIWHGVSKSEVLKFSPPLADKFAIDTHQVDASEAAIMILRMVRPDLYALHPRSQLEALASTDALRTLQEEIEELREQIAEYQCPHCRAPLVSRIDAPADDDQKHWDLVEDYECGHQRFGSMTQRPCPYDPKFPKFDDYEIRCEQRQGASGTGWHCNAFPKTDMASKVPLQDVLGRTEEEAREKLKASYLYKAGRLANAEWFKIQIS
jgi:hypothetical protein